MKLIWYIYRTVCKIIAKIIEIYMHENVFLINKWNIIQVYIIQAQSYQQFPKSMWTKYLLLCNIVNNLFIVIVHLLHWNYKPVI